jgi:hypothetical protein
VRFGLTAKKPGDWDCSSCDERHRADRNCGNRKGYKETLLQGAHEFLSVSAQIKAALKMGDIKLLACPISTITTQTWEILALVNDCTNADGDLLHLPFEGALLDQPPWFRDAVRIVRNERAEHRRKQMERKP